jgi:hypothetical protein
MTRIMYDSINLAGIPAGAQLVAHYVDGRYAASDADVDRFPDAARVGITVTTGDWRKASVIDVESGAMSPQDARAFVIARDQFRPGTATVYCNVSSLPHVVSACRGLDYHLWLAAWTPVRGGISLAPQGPSTDGEVAIQWRNTPGYDESVVFDDHWHPARA